MTWTASPNGGAMRPTAIHGATRSASCTALRIPAAVTYPSNDADRSDTATVRVSSGDGQSASSACSPSVTVVAQSNNDQNNSNDNQNNCPYTCTECNFTEECTYSGYESECTGYNLVPE